MYNINLIENSIANKTFNYFVNILNDNFISIIENNKLCDLNLYLNSILLNHYFPLNILNDLFTNYLYQINYLMNSYVRILNSIEFNYNLLIVKLLNELFFLYHILLPINDSFSCNQMNQIKYNNNN